MSDPLDEFPSFGLSDEWLAAIGALIVQWSVFEAILTSHLRTYLHQDRAAHLRPKHLKLSVTRRLALYDNLAPLFFSDAPLKFAKLATKTARAVKGDRDSFGHGMGIREGDDDALTVYRTDYLDTNEIRQEVTRMARERVIAAAAAMEEARLCLIRAYASVMRELVPPSWPEEA